MSSSSSDSDEDDARFREACDPTLSKAFNVSSDQQQTNTNNKKVENHLNNREEEINDTDNRHSFLLLSKIQRSLEDHKKLSLSKGSSLYQRMVSSKEKYPKEPTKPSYLARQLSTLLDQNVEFSKKADDSLIEESKAKNSKLENGEHKTSSEDFSLLHGVSLSLTDVGQQIPKKNFEKNKHRKCISYYGGLDEEELSDRCRNTAVTPDWILQKEGEYPWPHPKNIRYVDKYKAKKKNANGTIILTPIENCSIDKKKDKKKIKSSLGAPVNMKADETIIKSKLEAQNKKRKQSRKRGGKKKKNNEQTSILSSSKKT